MGVSVTGEKGMTFAEKVAKNMAKSMKKHDEKHKSGKPLPKGAEVRVVGTRHSLLCG